MIEKFPYGKAPFFIVAVAIVSALLSLASSRRRPPRADLVMVVFSDVHKQAYERALPRFERAHGAKIQVQLADWRGLRSRLQNAMLAGAEVPDVVEMFEGSLGFFTRGPEKDVGLLDLTARVAEERLTERLVVSRFSLWSSRGRIYGIPHDVHPVALAYRRDLVEAAGIDVAELDTWDGFVEAGRRVTRDEDGDGVIDRYMIDLPLSGGHGLTILMLQRGAQLFDAQGNVAFNSPETAEVFRFYLEQTLGPRRIAYDCGDTSVRGQSVLKAMNDGLALFYLAPDWRTKGYELDLPRLSGKLALMPLPAWTPGGRRTSVWGGTGAVIMRRARNPDLAWELVKFLYLDRNELGQRFRETHIIPPLKEAWNLPELNDPNPFFSGQKLGRVFADLAPETPPLYSAQVDEVARNKLNEAYTRVMLHYRSYGEVGLTRAIRAELARAEEYVERTARRHEVFAKEE